MQQKSAAARRRDVKFGPKFDATVESMIRLGKTWGEIAAEVGEPADVVHQRFNRTLKRQDLCEMAKRNRATRVAARRTAPAPGLPTALQLRQKIGPAPLPAMHPITWHILTKGTVLEAAHG